MKTIIILEGIATSGKTTLKEKLIKHFNDSGRHSLVIGEDQTLMPILENTDKEISLKLLHRVLSQALEDDAEIIIFDRLFFTHIFRTGSILAEFELIENLLHPHRTLIVLLTVNQDSIKERIQYAMSHRPESWTKFVQKKGTEEEITEYYTNQQTKLIELAKQSRLPTLILDTTRHNYDELLTDVLKKLNLNA